MAAVLGVSAHYHDAAAALIVDGKIIAAIQEERLSRMKNDASLPWRAITACLAEGGLEAGALDAVAYYENPYAKLERALVSVVRGFPRTRRQFGRALSSQLGNKIWVLDSIADQLRISRNKIHVGDHHMSHAASAYLCSPFPRAAILTVDGVGEEASTAIWRGEGRRIELVESIAFPHSLGLYYAAFTAWLGFAVNDGEYKVMGLAAFGQPRHAEEVARTLRLASDGSFELDLRYFQHTHDAELGFSPALEAMLGPRRPPNRAWDLQSDDDRRYADVAASVQARLEEAMLALARRAKAHTDADALCLAGGVALNAVANARLLREAGFARVFVQPAAGDAGGALGAALRVSQELGDPRPAPMTSVALGQRANGDEAAELATSLGLSAERVDDRHEAASACLLRGEAIGWMQGRFEWGPRALGQRSLLALPSDVGVRERLNRLVKEREPFRPFAPAVLHERAAAWFEDAPNEMTPFMTTVCRAKAHTVTELPAVCHVDGTSRVQTVETTNSLHALLASLERAGCPPLVLNTSLNLAGEPMVSGAVDALALFVRRPIDALFVEDVVIRRPA